MGENELVAIASRLLVLFGADESLDKCSGFTFIMDVDGHAALAVRSETESVWSSRRYRRNWRTGGGA